MDIEDKIKNGQCQYTLLCNEDGGIIDDLILYKIKEMTLSEII